jgi:hypothetical protein
VRNQRRRALADCACHAGHASFFAVARRPPSMRAGGTPGRLARSVRRAQARQWDITKATLMFRNHMEWRKKKGLDDWVATDKGPVPRFMLEFKFPELASVKAAYPFSHHHVARDGRPVYYDRLGAIDYKAMIKDSSAERVLEFFVWYSEASVVHARRARTCCLRAPAACAQRANAPRRELPSPAAHHGMRPADT